MRLIDLAWRDFVLWASHDAGFVGEFNLATGRNFRSVSASLIDRMIDEATGKAADDAEAFVLWVTEKYWGMDAPARVRQRLGRLPSVQPGVRRRASGQLRSLQEESETPPCHHNSKSTPR